MRVVAVTGVQTCALPICGGDARHGARLVLIRDVAGDPDGADHRAPGALPDQHTAGRRNDAAVGHGVQRREKRLLLGLIDHAPGQHPRTHAHAERAPGLSKGDLRADDPRAVLARECLQMSTGVEHGHRQRRAVGLARLAQRGLDDRHRELQGQLGHILVLRRDQSGVHCMRLTPRGARPRLAPARAGGFLPRPLSVTNGWTGGQYSVVRAIFGVVLCAQFLRTIGWGAESFSRVALLPDARSSPLARVFPNVLDVWSSPGAAIALLVVCAALSLLLAVGWWDRTAAVGLSYLGACFFVRSPLVASAWLPLAGWLLLVHTCLPPAPYGSVAALGRVDPAGAWRMPPLIFGAAWIVMAFGYSGGGYAKLLSRSWVDGVWTVSALELLFAPLALVAPLRPWLWLATLVVGLAPNALIGVADAGPGLALLHLLTLDPGWIRPRGAPAPERLFYDGSCGLCHRAVRFVLAEDRTGNAFR